LVKYLRISGAVKNVNSGEFNRRKNPPGESEGKVTGFMAPILQPRYYIGVPRQILRRPARRRNYLPRKACCVREGQALPFPTI